MLTLRAILADLDGPSADSGYPDAVNAENAVIPPPPPVRDDTFSTDTYAVNAENAEIPPPEAITAFRSFSAYTPAKSRHSDEPEPEPASVVCYVCRTSDFWQGSGAVVCRRCHPPAPGAERPATTLTRTDGDQGGAR